MPKTPKTITLTPKQLQKIIATAVKQGVKQAVKPILKREAKERKTIARLKQELKQVRLKTKRAPPIEIEKKALKPPAVKKPKRVAAPPIKIIVPKKFAWRYGSVKKMPDGTYYDKLRQTTLNEIETREFRISASAIALVRENKSIRKFAGLPTIIDKIYDATKNPKIAKEAARKGIAYFMAKNKIAKEEGREYETDLETEQLLKYFGLLGGRAGEGTLGIY